MHAVQLHDWFSCDEVDIRQQGNKGLSGLVSSSPFQRCVCGVVQLLACTQEGDSTASLGPYSRNALSINGGFIRKANSHGFVDADLRLPSRRDAVLGRKMIFPDVVGSPWDYVSRFWTSNRFPYPHVELHWTLGVVCVEGGACCSRGGDHPDVDLLLLRAYSANRFRSSFLLVAAIGHYRWSLPLVTAVGFDGPGGRYFEAQVRICCSPFTSVEHMTPFSLPNWTILQVLELLC